MKKLFTITVLMAFVAIALNVKAQDIYATGYYLENNQKVAAVYKNGEIIYTVHANGLNSDPKVILCDSEENVYWMVNHFNGSSFRYTEIWKNDQLYASTEGLTGVRILDIYCLNDTIYYTGYQVNTDTIKVATVWKGTDFTPHWVIGDGVHPSTIYDADVDRLTGKAYFCGDITDGKRKAAVWEGQELLYLYEGYENTTGSVATEISVDNGDIYTLGEYGLYTGFATYYYNAIWKNNEIIKSSDADDYFNTLCASNGNYYYCYSYPHGMYYSVEKNGHTIMQLVYDGSNGIESIRKTLNDIYMVGLYENNACIWKNFQRYSQPENCELLTDIYVIEQFPPDQSEWYYEILNNNGSITYQHLEYAADTTIGNERPKVIVRSNTQYDRDTITKVTHEYVYEENGIVYWWNKDLEKFTTLYDFTANIGDEWEIKVGMESLIMHVDTVENHEYEGKTYRMLRVSDPEDLFSGDIVCGIGHLTSFFPERLMNQGKNFRVEGLRCYWVGEELVYHDGDEDCDAIYAELHNVIEEPTNDAAFAVYPNPANNILFVQTLHATSLPTEQEYRITNFMGQILLQGHINVDDQQINIESLPSGMYFITVGKTTRKFVVE